MGVLEILKKQERERAIQEGAEQKSRDFVRNLILSAGFSDEKAAEIAEVSIDFVKKVRKAIEVKK